MGIINNTTPPILTTQQKQTRAKTAVTTSCNQMFRQMLSVYTNNMETVWWNPDGLTPQQVFNGFGTDAGELVNLATILATAINSAVPDSVSDTTPWPMIVNADGTVTVADSGS